MGKYIKRLETLNELISSRTTTGYTEPTISIIADGNKYVTYYNKNVPTDTTGPRPTVNPLNSQTSFCDSVGNLPSNVTISPNGGFYEFVIFTPWEEGVIETASWGSFSPTFFPGEGLTNYSPEELNNDFVYSHPGNYYLGITIPPNNTGSPIQAFVFFEVYDTSSEGQGPDHMIYKYFNFNQESL